MAFNPAVQEKMDRAADEAKKAWDDLMAQLDGPSGTQLNAQVGRKMILDWLKTYWYAAGYKRIAKIMLSKDFRNGRD